MNNTKIEWADKSWNPVTGCTKVSQGCKFCYAERLFPRAYPGREFNDVQLHWERLNQPMNWREPKRVFVNSMSDLFHPLVPDKFIDKVLDKMHQMTQHKFLILTKRPERMREYLIPAGPGSEKWLMPNVWIGVSIEDQKTADERIPILLDTLTASRGAVRWVSAEPLLGPINLEEYLELRTIRQHDRDSVAFHDRAGLDWVVVGGESGPNARPMNPNWARSLRDQCIGSQVPFFFKQWGEWSPKNSLKHQVFMFQDGAEVRRTGKTAGSRLLDDLEWNQFPGDVQ